MLKNMRKLKPPTTPTTHIATILTTPYERKARLGLVKLVYEGGLCKRRELCATR